MRGSHRMLRRREFLGQVGTASIGCSLAGTAIASVDLRESSDSNEHPLEFSHERWAELVGNRFSVLSAQAGNGNQIDLVLCDVRVSASSDEFDRPACCRRQPFSLLFESHGGVRIANATHLISNQAVEAFPLFLHESPRTDRSGSVFYEAVFG